MYSYKGLSAAGEPVQGVREAESLRTLRQLLRREGVVMTSSSTARAAAEDEQATGLAREVRLGDLFGGIRKAEVAAFTRQLATLLHAGIPLSESLGALFEQTENPRFKGVVHSVRESVQEGSSLADALSKHPKAYDTLFCSMVRAGETAGNLDDVLARLADFMESGQALKGKVQGAMVYPLIMIVVGTIIMAILMVAVVPKITSLFVQQGRSLPWNTTLLITVSEITGKYWWAIATMLVLGIIFGRRWASEGEGQKKWHAVVLKLPLVGSLIRQLSVGRFCRTLGTMLSSGVPMLKALDISKDILGNVILMKAVDDARVAVAEGESLAVTLKRSGYFPATVTHMVGVGERAGELETMLIRVADAYEAEVDMRLNRLTTMLEPLMLVVMGGAVAFVVFSILMPIMDMGQFQ